ncbi:MAG: M56 family metallopeptidase [Chitinophagaceae bacterium]|nr:MAG: M56 family metallopeptidase [Chitinophagaceae bacterium]
MEQFAYSFSITLLHSVWQMALLLLVYYGLISLFRNSPPLARRNLLLLTLGIQLVTSIITFFLLYSSPLASYTEGIQAILRTLNTPQDWLNAYAPGVLGLYIAGLLYNICKTYSSWNMFRHTYRRSLIKAPVDIRLFTTAKALHFSIKRKVQVWCSAHIQSPLTFGFLKPVILLPVAMVNQLTLQQTESLIVHELTHIKNNDYLYNWFLLIIDALFFFNPFVKIAVQQIKREREKTCDVQVLQFNYPAFTYAEALLHIAQQGPSTGMSLSMAAVNKKEELLNRIRFFTDEKNLAPTPSSSKSIGFICLLGFFLLNLFFAGIFVTAVRPISPAGVSFSEAPGNQWQKAFAAVQSEAQDYMNPEEELSFTTAPVATTFTENEDADMPPVSAAENEPLPALSPSMPSAVETLALTPVSFTDAGTQLVKDVIINEESSNGIKITQAYRVITSASGEIRMEPLWMISELPPSDSLKKQLRLDSTVVSVVPTVQ